MEKEFRYPAGHNWEGLTPTEVSEGYARVSKENLIDELRKHIITESEIQRIISLPDDSPDKGIEFSLTGELIPFEIVEGKFAEVKEKLKEEIDRLYKEEEKVHKNHRVQAILRDLKIFTDKILGEEK